MWSGFARLHRPVQAKSTQGSLNSNHELFPIPIVAITPLNANRRLIVGAPRRAAFNRSLCRQELHGNKVMSLLALPCSAFRDFYLKEIKTRTRELAGPPPSANYQGHQFAEIRLSFGELSLPNIGRYSAKVGFRMVWHIIGSYCTLVHTP